jgi:hypothetical protein
MRRIANVYAGIPHVCVVFPKALAGFPKPLILVQFRVGAPASRLSTDLPRWLCRCAGFAFAAGNQESLDWDLRSGSGGYGYDTQ